MLAGKDIISISELTKDDILTVLELAKELKNNPKQLLQNKILATLFFEPSTRTRLSFTAAMLRLGGQVLGFESTETTSIKKGESLHDTIKMVECYADAIVIRHPESGSARLAADASSKPVINAGDGINEHPTQALLDLYTILEEKGTLDNLNISFVGDLKNGRTVHSLCKALSHFKSNLFFISPPGLEMPEPYVNFLKERAVSLFIEHDLQKVSEQLDVIYMTRVQKERFSSLEEYEKYKGIYKLDKQFLKIAKKDVSIMHPLPRVDEISIDIDNTPNAAYFRQAANGLYIRQALIALVLGAIKKELVVN